MSNGKRTDWLFWIITLGFLIYDFIVFQWLDLVVPLDIDVFGVPLRSPNFMAVILWVWGAIIIVWCINYLIQWWQERNEPEMAKGTETSRDN
jgi:hypothetical protein